MKKRFAAIFPALLLLSACATTQPGALTSMNENGSATIRGTSSGSIFGASKMARVDAIDGVALGPSMYSSKRALTPGHHTIRVLAYFTIRYGKAFEAYVNIPVVIKPNQNYLTEFNVVGANVDASIAAENGGVIGKAVAPFKEVWIG